MVTEPGVTVEPGELLEFLTDRMPYFMVPRYLEFVAGFPKTPSLRVQKHLLREQGNGPLTWDAVRAGYEVTRHGLIKHGVTRREPGWQ